MARFVTIMNDVINLDLVRRVTKRNDRELSVYFSNDTVVEVQGAAVNALWWYLQQLSWDYEAQYALYLCEADVAEKGVRE